MFCQYCGAPINDEALFCKKCGKPITEDYTGDSDDNAKGVVVVNSNNAMTSAKDIYDREALKVYLGTIRSLEYAKQKLTRDINNLDSRISRLAISRRISKPNTDREWFDSLVLTWVGLAAMAGVVGAIIDIPVHWLSDSHIVRIIGFVIAAIILAGDFIYLVYLFFKSQKYLNEEQERYSRETQEEATRIKNEQKEKDRLLPIRQAIYDEYLAANQLLANAYSVDIIPSQFRNIYAVYYIYDFISTSNESFSNALMHCDLDVIKCKLDAIIANQETIILNQAIIMAQNDELMEQNKQHMKHLASIEQNQVIAIKYTQIAANNAEACAWIAAANYIR